MIELCSTDESLNGKILKNIDTPHLIIPVPADDGWGQAIFEFSGEKKPDGTEIWEKVTTNWMPELWDNFH